MLSYFTILLWFDTQSIMKPIAKRWTTQLLVEGLLLSIILSVSCFSRSSSNRSALSPEAGPEASGDASPFDGLGSSGAGAQGYTDGHHAASGFAASPPTAAADTAVPDVASRPPISDFIDASASDATTQTCVSCGDRLSESWDSQHVSSTEDILLLLAEDVSAVVGGELRFIELNHLDMALLAEFVSTGESVIVTDFPGGSRGDVLNAYRLPEASRHLRFVAEDNGEYFLACDAEECTLFEIDKPTLPLLRAIAGATFGNDHDYDRIVLYEYQLCVLGNSSVARCYDRELWVEKDATLIMSSSHGQAEAMGTEPIACVSNSYSDSSTPDNAIGPLVIWQIGSEGRVVVGATADGRIVSATWQGIPICCCPRTVPLGTPLDLAVYECGLSTNVILLTENAVYGTSACAVD